MKKIRLPLLAWLVFLVFSLATPLHAQNFQQMIKLIESDRENLKSSSRGYADYFGYSVAISGDYAIVGAPLEDDDAAGGSSLSAAGSAFIFMRSDSNWRLQQKIVASDRGANDNFGYSVSIDGNYAIVSAAGDEQDALGANSLNLAGSAYIFVRSGSTWSQQQKIVASDRAAIDKFGYSVAISGSFAIVSANNNSYDAAGANYFLNAGSAYIFKRLGSTWSQQQKIVAADRNSFDHFGESVGISGNHAIVGASQESEDAAGANTALTAGSAYIFERSGSTWSQQQKIVASDRDASDYFGISVAISGNYVIVGAMREDEDAVGANPAHDAGSAYIFKLGGSTWSQQQKLVTSDRASGDEFGISVAISGTYAMVGAHYEDEDAAGGNTAPKAGSAYMFSRLGSTWTQEQKIVSGDRSSSDKFGGAVAISANYAFFGTAYQDEDANGGNYLSDAGSAYAFNRSGGIWSQQEKLTPGTRMANDLFGFALAIDGDYAIVSANREDENALGTDYIENAGAAYIFFRNGGTWAFQQKIVASDRGNLDYFGESVAISGDYAIVSAPQEDEDAAGLNSANSSGSVYIYHRSGTSWTEQQKIVATDRGVDDQFGASVDISGDYLIVGADKESEDANGINTLTKAGSAYIFHRSGTAWSQQQKLVASDRALSDYFGSSVAISGNYVIVSAVFEDEDAAGLNYASSAGSAYIFNRSGTTWTQQQKIVASDRAGADYFGTAVDMDGDYAVISAYREDQDAAGGNTASSAGSAYIFSRTGTTWTQQQKIVASDRASNDVFGRSVSISGDYLVVGADLEDEDASGLNTASLAGSAYIFGRSGTTWTEIQKIVSADRQAGDVFGFAVGISGNTVMVGAYNEDEDVAGSNTLNGAGSVYVFASTTPLPLKLLSFDAQKAGKRNRLVWQTATEETNTTFNIERSTDAKLFLTIGSAFGKSGNSNYTFYDKEPANLISYYRLRIAENKGRNSYSKVVSVHRGSLGQSIVYPSPASDYIIIESPATDSLSASITDLMGRTILKKMVESGKQIAIFQLQPGNYVLKLSNGETFRIVKE